MRRRSPRFLVGGAPEPAHTVTFDGRELPALPGQSVAAVLWAAGILAWRTTREGGAPRGVFCGIGSCHDCLVTVNGRPNQRACLVPARPGDAVTTQEGTGHGDLAV
ncbi:(2Fe-2S)-binding protein [Streptomyces sp. NPDC048606]|uniref:(2Fe-2S)-binding protein n=1 Tax=Streptomyces sp. NPDC048606 TaxID=3154726 RepID=UPI003417ACCC